MRTQTTVPSHQDIGVVAYPADRVIVQNQVAQGAAAQGSDDGHDQHAEQVHGFAPGHQRAGDGEDRHAEQVGEIEQLLHGALSD
jgi:hypothetical protein